LRIRCYQTPAPPPSQELNDPIALAACTISLLLNLVVSLQIAMLGGAKAAADRKKKTGKAE
jgi:hypothetical protein